MARIRVSSVFAVATIATIKAVPVAGFLPAETERKATVMSGFFALFFALTAVHEYALAMDRIGRQTLSE